METNQMRLTFKSISENVSFVRATVGAFLAKLNITMDQLYDIKMAVSEAVTNSIIHGYSGDSENEIELGCMYKIEEQITIEIYVKDTGKGINDIEQSKQPMFTTAEDRAGLGFTVMESVIDNVCIESEVGKGTTITLHTKLQAI
ncbi:MAG: anti-sigma F factor [Epulopiscium sp. Nele67-Bin004]|nr:MAG: anti-sigma F factor [Epulopiscium sp. Nele67-Bin004]